MKLLKYVPKDPKWEGFVELKVPNYKERLRMAQDLNLSSIADAPMVDQIDKLSGLHDAVLAHVNAVDLKFEGIVFNSVDDLEYYKEGYELINEIGGVLMSGITLGKPLPKP